MQAGTKHGFTSKQTTAILRAVWRWYRGATSPQELQSELMAAFDNR